MNEIVILSGKGGTGKTSLAATLAVLAGDKAVIADCDVDAANLHLILKPDYLKSSDFFSGVLAVINQDVCIQCGRCAEICRFQAIVNDKGKYKIIELNCDGCGYCEKVCRVRAIAMHKRKSGMVFISNTRAGNMMVHARLGIGSENSGKLVTKVKSDARNLAITLQKEYIIVDGSPGIGCPVVASLAGADYVLLVTEPTMSALHDLERMVLVMEKFRIRAGCIINKSDLNEKVTQDIRNFLAAKNIDHLADIPYDNTFTMAMIEGKTIVEMPTYLKSTVRDIWSGIKEKIKSLNSLL
ncbi:MAG: (4Fe-4S)-binding protein [Alphaproteobacteria bacterium]|nr:(4Fe-4S)-binding protein [Alphaproteobacteria bacterium]